MGREPGRPGKHVLHAAAGIILTFVTLTACAPMADHVRTDERCSHLQGVQQLIDSGDYEGALRAAQEKFDRDQHGSVGDAAIFDLALLNAHPGNPKKDYRKSLALFIRLVREYPQSPLVDESKIWIGVLESIEKAKKIDIEIDEKKKGIIK